MTWHAGLGSSGVLPALVRRRSIGPLKKFVCPLQRVRKFLPNIIQLSLLFMQRINRRRSRPLRGSGGFLDSPLDEFDVQELLAFLSRDFAPMKPRRRTGGHVRGLDRATDESDLRVSRSRHDSVTTEPVPILAEAVYRQSTPRLSVF